MIEQRKLEDYMRIIYLETKENGYGKSATLSRTLHVSRPTVSVALKRMAADGYLEFDESSRIHLTPKGEALAEQVAMYHDMIRSLLIELGLAPEEAAEEANQMEHALSPRSFEALSALQNALREKPSCVRLRHTGDGGN